MESPRQAGMKFIAFDYGTKSTGLAVGNRLTGGAEPLPPLPMKKGRADEKELIQLVRAWQPDAFVLGMPAALNDDSAGAPTPDTPAVASTENPNSDGGGAALPKTETAARPNAGAPTPPNLPKRIHNFAAFLRRKFNLPCYFVDERLSSRVMEKNLRAGGASPHYIKQHLDSAVAQALLCEWFEQQDSAPKLRAKTSQ